MSSFDTQVSTGQRIRPLDNTYAVFRQSFAERCARCLYGELERGCEQLLTYNSPCNVAGIPFTNKEDQEQLTLDIASKLASLIAQVRRPRFTLIAITISPMDDNLHIVAQIECL